MLEIDEETKVLGVIGDPIKHTLSPVIHNTISDEMGINAYYVPIHVTDNLGDAVVCAAKMGIDGMNVTVPYKQEVMESLINIDEAAAQIGAVNTLVPSDDGYTGYNTDMPGLYRALEKKGISLEGKAAVVLGAGGASRAVCMMLITYGAEKIYLVNRTLEKAKQVAELSDKIIPVSLSEYKSIPDGKYIMFQCTSLGLKAGDGLLIEDEEFYKMADFGYDLVYNPPETPFIKMMKRVNAGYDNGLSMLLYQGVIAYEKWFDLSVPESVLKIVWDRLKEAVYSTVKSNKSKNIVLTGYMASGKTTIGKALAEKLGYTFIDTDEEIVRREGRTINDIFASEGEEGFRKIETEVLKSLTLDACTSENVTKTDIYNEGYTKTGLVISTGGGIVLRKQNMPMLKKLGTVIYLKADEETTFSRVKNDTSRPLLSSESEKELREKISNMLKERRGYYEITSDVKINTADMEIGDIIEEIIKQK